MEKIFYEKPYVCEFEAKVISCEKGKEYYEIILNKTAFYPEGGGQPSDMGVLGGVNVIKVQEKGGLFVHYTDAPLEKGAAVTGKLDWDRRFINMQQHSGEHIVSGLIHAIYGYDNVGFHMGSEEMTIDLNGALTWEQLMAVERRANAVVYQNLPLQITYPTSEELDVLEYRSKKELTGQVRIVEVPGADVCACCGTHVSRTGEIGLIKFLSMINYKGGVRITMACGRKALLDYEKKTEQTNCLSSLLSAKPELITEAVERLLKEKSEQEYRFENVMRELLELKAKGYKECGQGLLVFEQGLSSVQVRRFCELLLEKGKGSVVAVLSAKEGGGYHYCAGSRTFDMMPLGKTLNALLSGRGGGSALMIQGTFLADEPVIREVFENETKNLY